MGRGRRPGLLRSACSCGRPASTAPRGCTGTPAAMQGEPFKYFAYGVAASEVEVDGFTGAYRTAARRHRPRRRRQPVAAHRHRPDRGRFRAGRRLAHARGPALGRARRPDARPARDAGGQHLQAAEPLGDARAASTSSCSSDAARGRCRLRLQGASASRRSCWRSRCARRCGRRRPRSGRRAPASTWRRPPRRRPSTGRSSAPARAPARRTTSSPAVRGVEPPQPARRRAAAPAALRAGAQSLSQA